MRLLLGMLLIPLVMGKHGGEDGNSEDDASSLASTSSTSPTSSPIPPAQSSSTSSTFIFDSLNNATTCRNTTLTWRYAGVDDIQLTITITNSPASAGMTGINVPIALVSRVLGNTISSKAQQIEWSPVDVPAGQYQAVAFNTEQLEAAPPITVRSSAFFVLAGDTTCLTMPTSPPIAQPGPPGSASPSLPTSSASTSPDGAAASPASDGTDTRSKSLSPGALAGTVIGVVAGVLLLLLAFTFPQILRRTLPTRAARARRPGGPYMLF